MASRAKRSPIAIPEHSPISIDASAFPAFPRSDRKSFTNRNATAHPHPRTCYSNEPAADVLPQASCPVSFSTLRAVFMPQTYGRASVAQSIPCRYITTHPHNVRETKKLLSLIICTDILH